MGDHAWLGFVGAQAESADLVVESDDGGVAHAGACTKAESSMRTETPQTLRLTVPQGQRVMLPRPAQVARVSLYFACGGAVMNFVRPVTPVLPLSGLVLPEATMTAVRGFVEGARVSVTTKAAGALFVSGDSVSALNVAGAIAQELGRGVFRVDLSAVVSKYIGETEKNLDLIFKAADEQNAVLFFDEADALFGKRSEVKNAHGRYRDIEAAYLLQKMESFAGVAILATKAPVKINSCRFCRYVALSAKK